MWSKLEEVFEKIGVEYARQGSYSDESEYPESFFTFWQFDCPEKAFYNNKATKAIWFWNVYYYTNDPSTLYSKMDEFVSIAKEAGFIIDGRPRDAKSDRPDYPGRFVRVIYVERYLNEEV